MRRNVNRKIYNNLKNVNATTVLLVLLQVRVILPTHILTEGRLWADQSEPIRGNKVFTPQCHILLI